MHIYTHTNTRTHTINIPNEWLYYKYFIRTYAVLMKIQKLSLALSCSLWHEVANAATWSKVYVFRHYFVLHLNYNPQKLNSPRHFTMKSSSHTNAQSFFVAMPLYDGLEICCAVFVRHYRCKFVYLLSSHKQKNWNILCQNDNCESFTHKVPNCYNEIFILIFICM